VTEVAPHVVQELKTRLSVLRSLAKKRVTFDVAQQVGGRAPRPDPTRPYTTLHYHTRPYTTIHDHTRPYTTLYDRVYVCVGIGSLTLWCVLVVFAVPIEGCGGT
jgi:uncharacterized protein YerC